MHFHGVHHHRPHYKLQLQRSLKSTQRSTKPHIVKTDSNIFPLFLCCSPVWPERSSSAAGVRTCDLISSFQQDRSCTVSYASPSAANEHTALIQSQGVQIFECLPNNEPAFLAVLEATQPQIVIFDRFYAEEMYSFRVKERFPHALRVLDMQDCHFLREGRQEMATKKKEATMNEILECRPDATAASCLRELSSIHRCDLTMVCSPVELQILTDHYNVTPDRLILAPFFTPPSPHAASPVPYHHRHHFIMIGNFRHPPNFDSVKWAVKEIWPKIRAAHKAAASIDEVDSTSSPLPELHLYGSYAPQAASELHKPAQGVFFKGFAPSLDIMTSYKVCLATLRFGAGLKGKVIDSWWHGLPVCTTPIGAEGMTLMSENEKERMGGTFPKWGGVHSGSTSEEIAEKAVQLYCNVDGLWDESQARGFELLEKLYNGEEHLNVLHRTLDAARSDLEKRRARDFVGGMLWQNQMRATEYFSRWIELKEKNKIMNE